MSLARKEFRGRGRIHPEMEAPDPAFRCGLSAVLIGKSKVVGITFADLQSVGVEPDLDEDMETVRTEVNRPASMCVFIGVKAIRR